jgi:hypothetical protein
MLLPLVPMFRITAARFGGDSLPLAAAQRAGTSLGARPLLIKPEADDGI